MREKTTKKNVRNAHLMLAAYWGYRVLMSGNIPKATFEVLLMENRAVRKEKQDARLKEQKEQQEKNPAVRKASIAAAASGAVRNTALRKAAGKILKSARVI